MTLSDGQQLPDVPAEPVQILPPGASLQDAAEWLRSCGVLTEAVQAGEMVPDFELADTASTLVSLGTLLDRGPLVVTFTLGSGSTVCRASLRALQDALPLIKRHHGSIVAISPDPPATSRRLAQDDGLSFELLADDEGHLGGLFGLSYQPPEPPASWFELLGLDWRGRVASAQLILPAAYVVNAEGTAAYAFLDPHPHRRVDPQALTCCLSRLATGTPAPPR